MSAWRKVFLRNGLIWTAYLGVFAIADGLFSKPGWPLGFSEGVNQVVTLSLLLLMWVVMAGGGSCLFRRVVQGMATETRQQGKRIPTMRWRWYWSYFLEVDEDYRLRP